MATENKVPDTQEEDLAALQGKYLTFMLDNEEYGVEILNVKEIIGLMSITELPKTPEYVKGVINLRGKVIPVIDLRLRFGLEEIEHTEKTCIIVVEITKDGSTLQLGIIVDAVSEVMNVGREDLEPTPRFGISLNTDFILAMAKSRDTVRTLLDIGTVLGSDDIGTVAKKV